MPATKFLIVHISDLHFGPSVQNPYIHRSSTLPQGMFPHDPAACDELEIAISDLLQSTRPERVLLVTSGDLTVHGCNDEFCVALSFLRGRIRESWKSALGLQHITDSCWAVPGNHDHWRCNLLSSSVINVRHSLIHATYFPSLPAQTFWHAAHGDGSLQLQLMGIDTNGGASLHFGARGAVDAKDLGELGKLIDDADQNAADARQHVVRVLVLHHSMSPGSGVAGWAHALDAASVDALRDFCRRKGVDFLLTGHVHAPAIPSGGAHRPFELRCGTTLQGAGPGRLPTPRGQSFLAHFVEELAGKYTWRTEVYERQWTTYGATQLGLDSSAFKPKPDASESYSVR